MNKIMIFLLVFSLGGMALWAHAASAVTLSYNQQGSLLTVNFSHSVRDAADHFINRVTIRVGRSEVLVHNLSLQETAAGGSLSYKLPGLRRGDVVSVQTQCNKGGRKSTQITIP